MCVVNRPQNGVTPSTDKAAPKRTAVGDDKDGLLKRSSYQVRQGSSHRWYIQVESSVETDEKNALVHTVLVILGPAIVCGHGIVLSD